MQRKRRPFISTPIFTIIGRIGGFLLPILLAYFYKADYQTDSFFVAFWLIYFFGSLFTHMLESVLLPYLFEEKQKGSPVVFVNRMALVNLAFALGFFLVAWLLMASGKIRFASNNELVITIFMEMAPLLIFGVLNSAMNSYFYSEKIFWFPAMSPVIRTLVAFPFMYFMHQKMGIHAASVGLALGEVFRMVISHHYLKKLCGWRFDIRSSRTKNSIRKVIQQSMIQMVALSAINLVGITNQWFASKQGEGSISLFIYADRLIFIPNQLILMGVILILHADWSDIYEGKSKRMFWSKMLRDVRRIFWIATCFSLSAWAMRGTMIQMFYGGSDLSPEQKELITSLFGWMILGFAPAVLNILYSRVLFIMRRPGFSCIYSWVQYLGIIALNCLLIPRFGMEGIALATIFGMSLTAVWLHLAVIRYRKKFYYPETSWTYEIDT